jgi:glycosyltransferase involved in cell wall biosynthesis
MRTVAIVYQKYQNPDRPYLQFWNDDLHFKDISLVVFFCSGAPENKHNEYRVLYSSSKLHILKRLFLFFFSWPAKTLKYFLNTEADSEKLKKKFIEWTRYAPLIVLEPDVLYLMYSSLYPRFEDLLSNSKIVVSFRGSDINVEPWTKQNWQNILTKQLFKKVDCLHFVCKSLLAEAKKIDGDLENHKIIYPGIDETFFCPTQKLDKKDDQKIIITTTGRLTWQKGYIVSLQAIKILQDKGFDVKYHILGGGDSYDELIFWRRKLDVESNVDLSGRYFSPREVRDYLESTDIYIQPSIIEGVPIAIMEAMAMELPVIASNVGGISELVVDGVTGVLVPPADPDTLTKQIIRLINADDKRVQMGKAGRKRILEKFSLQRELSEWIDLFSSL